MESPLFRYRMPPHGFYATEPRQIPVNTPGPQTTPPRSHSHSKNKKAVTIPVHFIGSDKSRSESALKIQKAFRGFRIRQNVKNVLAIRREVDQLEKSILETETLELIKCDAKTRLKVNEMLMSLLIKLDSVNGVNDAVRESRKAVIRKAILLQERIDSLVVAAANSDRDNSVKIDENVVDAAVDTDDNLKESESTEIVDDTNANHFEEIVDETLQIDENVVDNPSDVMDDQKSDLLANAEDEAEKRDEEGTFDLAKRSSNDWGVVNNEEESKKSKKLLEKMAADNEKLVALVADLCERNEMQAHVICSLSYRVEQLEKAMNERLKRKKKKNAVHN